MSKLVSIAQIMSVVFVGLFTGYGVSQEQPSPRNTDNQSSDSRVAKNIELTAENFAEGLFEYIPSPFAIAPNLTAFPSSISESEQSNEEFFGRKKISLQARFLNVDDATHARIMKMIGSENLTMSGGPLVSESTPDQLVIDELSEKIIARESTLKGQPAVMGSVSMEKFAGIVSEIKKHPKCTINQTPTALVFEEQLSTIVDGAARPFVVSVKPKVHEDWVQQIPVIQNIEEGIILRQKAKVTEDGIRIATNLISNEITDVDTFTFDGSETEGVTVQVPTCKCQQVNCQFVIAKGTMVIVDPNFVEVQEVRKQRKGVASHWLSKPKAQTTKTRRLIAFTARVTD